MEIYLNDPATTPDEDLLTEIRVPVWLPIGSASGVASCR